MEHIEQGPGVELEVKDKFRRLVDEHFLQRVMPYSSASTSPSDSVTTQDRFHLPTNLGMYFFHLWFMPAKVYPLIFLCFSYIRCLTHWKEEESFTR